MARAGLVTHTTDPQDARRRLVALTPEGPRAAAADRRRSGRRPLAAMAELDAELSMPLAQLLTEVAEAVHSRPFRDRIEAARQRREAPEASE